MTRKNQKKTWDLEILFYFLKLGSTSFGGPFAFVAALQKDLVEQKKWMEESEFQSVLTLIKAMPGPLAFNTAAFMGYYRGGFIGAVFAAIGTLLPAFSLMVLLARSSGHWAGIAWVQELLMGAQLAALAILFASLLPLARPYMKQKFFWFYAVLALVLLVYLQNLEPLWIILFGLSHIVLRRRRVLLSLVFLPALALWPFWSFLIRAGGNDGSVEQGLGAASGSALTAGSFWAWPWESENFYQLFLTCLKAGAFVFGTGVAAIPILKEGLTGGLISEGEFLTALAFGQMTPGPITITVTYIGYKLFAWPGALFATLGMYLPSFIHMSTWFPRATRFFLRQGWIVDFTFGAMSVVFAAILLAGLDLTLTLQPELRHVSFLAMLLIVGRFVPSWALIVFGSAFWFLLNLIAL